MLNPETQLGMAAGDDDYVLTWLAIAERLHLDALYDKCMTFIAQNFAGTDGLIDRRKLPFQSSRWGSF